MGPQRMNNSDIGYRRINTDVDTGSPMSSLFRQPSTPGKKYHDEIILSEYAQFSSKSFEKRDMMGGDISLKSDAYLVISADDWESNALIKGDIITKVGPLAVNMLVNEIRPSAFRFGEPTLYYALLIDNNRVAGGIK